MNEHVLFTLLDLGGTFAFAISGATAARQRNLDIFGILAVAYIVACGGGIIRDLCIGAIPPVGLTNELYLAVAVVAALMTIGAYRLVDRLAQPVLLFDALGLAFFAVSGAHKTLQHGYNAEAAILLGMISAVGGGVLRDVLLNRIPVILRKEIYAAAALVGASIEVAGEHLGWSTTWLPWLGILACFGLRYLSLRYQWNLPRLAHNDEDRSR